MGEGGKDMENSLIWLWVFNYVPRIDLADLFVSMKPDCTNSSQDFSRNEREPIH